MSAIGTVSEQMGAAVVATAKTHAALTIHKDHRQTFRRAQPSDLPPVVSLVHAARLAALAGNVVAVAAHRSAVLAGWGR